MREVKKGSTAQSYYVRLINVDGSPATSVTTATGGLQLWYQRGFGAIATFTAVDLVTLDDPWTAGGIKHSNDGVYRVDAPNAAQAAGSVTSLLVSAKATNISGVPEMVVLSTYNESDRVIVGGVKEYGNTATAYAADTVDISSTSTAAPGDWFEVTTTGYEQMVRVKLTGAVAGPLKRLTVDPPFAPVLVAPPDIHYSPRASYHSDQTVSECL